MQTGLMVINDLFVVAMHEDESGWYFTFNLEGGGSRNRLGTQNQQGKWSWSTPDARSGLASFVPIEPSDITWQEGTPVPSDAWRARQGAV